MSFVSKLYSSKCDTMVMTFKFVVTVCSCFTQSLIQLQKCQIFANVLLTLWRIWNTFLHINIWSDKGFVFSANNFTNHAYRFTIIKKCLDNYEDIHDGHLYKYYMATNDILASVNNISLTWNIDGLSIFPHPTSILINKYVQRDTYMCTHIAMKSWMSLKLKKQLIM